MKSEPLKEMSNLDLKTIEKNLEPKNLSRQIF